MNLWAMLGIGVALAAGSNETIWWKTNGGTVVGFHDTQECALLLYTRDHGLVFTWGSDGAEKIAVQDTNLNFADDGQSTVMIVRIGDTTIGTTSAVGISDYVSGKLTQPVEDLLHSAEEITVQFLDKEVRFAINRARISALLDAVDKCRNQRR